MCWFPPRVPPDSSSWGYYPTALRGLARRQGADLIKRPADLAGACRVRESSVCGPAAILQAGTAVKPEMRRPSLLNVRERKHQLPAVLRFALPQGGGDGLSGVPAAPLSHGVVGSLWAVAVTFRRDSGD